MARTQEERKAHTRALLLAAAAELFATKGFHAVSAEAVADAAGRTTGAIYAHFGSKDGLLLALVESWLDEGSERIADAVAQAGDLDGRLLAIWRAFSSDDPAGHAWALLEFEVFLHGAREPVFADLLATRYDRYRDELAPPLAQWVADEGLGRLRRRHQVAGHVIGVLLGMAMQHRIDPDAVADADVVSALRAVIERNTAQ